MKRDLPAYCYLRKRSGGREYVYFERGGKATRITEEPGTPAFAVAYAKLLNGVAPIPSTRDFRGLVRSYVAGKGYRKLAPRTAKDYDRVLEWVKDKWGDVSVASIERRHVIRAQEAGAGEKEE